MTAGLETLAAEEWIYGRLAADTLLAAQVGSRIYSYRADDGATFPYVLFQQQAASDVLASGPVRLGSSLLYLVRVVGEASSTLALKDAAARIDVALQAARGTAADGTVWGCSRERPFVLVESVQLRQVRHLGGLYRLWVA